MKIVRFLGWIVLAISGAAPTAFAATANGISGYQSLGPSRLLYTFVAWPQGQSEPLFFKSTLTLRDSASSVRIDEGSFFPKNDETPVRKVADFDSLKAYALAPVRSVHTPQGLLYVRDTVWHKASVVERQWVFPRIVGAISLFSTEPGHGGYRGMDTGSGIVPYSEAAVRLKIRSNPRSAQLLDQEILGHKAAWWMGYGGLGLVGLGMVANLATDNNAGHVAVLAGLGVAAFAWLPHILVEGKYEAALRLYNLESARR
jgi:hypothetical protein